MRTPLQPGGTSTIVGFVGIAIVVVSPTTAVCRISREQERRSRALG
jgi:hypothetical protein